MRRLVFYMMMTTTTTMMMMTMVPMMSSSSFSSLSLCKTFFFFFVVFCVLCCLCFVWSPFSLLSFFFFSGVALSFRSHKQATKKSDTYFSSQNQRSRLIRGVINSRVDRFDWFLSLSLSLFLTHTHSQAFLSSSFPLHTTHTPSRHHHQRATKREKE